METIERESFDEADLKATDPGLLVKLAATGQAVTGILVALCGLQIVGLRARFILLEALPYVFLVGGVALIGLAARVYRARLRATYVAAFLTPLLMLILGSWIVISAMQVFSCLMMVAMPLSFFTSLCGLAAVRDVRRAAAARARLEAAGMGLGI